MTCPARALSEDQPLPSVAETLRGLARSAKHNVANGNLTSMMEGAAAVGSNPMLNLTTSFTPDAWGNVTGTKTPLGIPGIPVTLREWTRIRPCWTVSFRGSRPGANLAECPAAPDDRPRPSRPVAGALRHLARAANDDAAHDKLTSTTRNAAAGTTFTAAETTTTAFDPNGNKTQVSVLNGTLGAAALSVTQMNYDGLNRVICTAARENAAAFTALPDACAQSAGGAYGPDPITKAAYDLAGQALSETRGYGTPLAQAYATFTWGADGEKLSIKDANSNTIHLGYDGFNRLNKITHPDATFETSVYDPDGDLVIWTNRGGYGVVRCYDVLNRKISETGITGASLSGACATGGAPNTQAGAILPRTFGYDLAGRLTAANIPNYPLSYAYDAAGRPSSRGTWSASYGWDNAGNLQTLGYPDGATVVTYQYDPLNRTTKALIGATSYGTLTYDALGRRQKLTFAGGSTQTWNYDNADRVTSIAHVFPTDTGDNVTFTYGYDPSGRDASRTLDNSAYAYAPTAASTSYAAANALNQYPTVGGYTYSWWPNGELNQTDTYQANYDEFGKLMLANITVTPGTVDPNDAEFMGEDALDHIYFHGRATTAGDTHPFIYHSTDGLRPETILEWQCLQTGGGVPTCTGTGTGTRAYVLGPDPDERWAFINTNGTTYDPHTDREGTLIALANRGNVSQIYTWDAYGQNSAPSNDAGQGPPGYLYRYTGQRFDPNTSLYDYKARTYSPGLGRFLQPDPKGVDQGPNLFAYVGNDPVGAADPDGLGCIGTCPDGWNDSNTTLGVDFPRGIYVHITVPQIVIGMNVAAMFIPAADAAEAPAAARALSDARLLNASRGLSAKMSELMFQGHHPLPMFLGGSFNQRLETLTAGLHSEFHAMLASALKEAGFDLPIGGKGGAARDWANYFNRNPGSQQRALGVVQKVSDRFDQRFGTNLGGAATKQVCTGSRIAQSGPC